MKTLIALACFALTAATAGAQVTGGRQLYESRCARCHGGDAAGGESGPGIVSQIDARADADLTDFLRAGRPAAGMPALDGNAATADEMKALVTYLRTLVPTSRTAPPVVVRKKVRLTSGETLEGRVLNEGMSDLQLRTNDQRIHLLRKFPGDRYRLVTSQTRLADLSRRAWRQSLHDADADR